MLAIETTFATVQTTDHVVDIIGAPYRWRCGALEIGRR